MAEIRLKSTGTIKLFENDNTSSVTIASPASLGADRTITLPDASVTLASGTMLATDGSGASLTALNASELGSGTVPTARLGSGTASSSTVLYGDQTYKAEPSGVAGTNLFRAAMGSSQTGVTSNTWTKTTFDTDTFDADSVFDTSNNRFIAPADGKYFFIAKVYIYPETANGPRYWTRFYKNGGAATEEVVAINLGGSDNYLAEIAVCNSTIIALSENDYIEFYSRFQAGSGTVTFDKSESYFLGCRIA